MNELEFLRQQLATESRNFSAVAAACAAALAPGRPPADREFLQSCTAYLRLAAARAIARDAAHAALLRTGPDAAESGTRALQSALEANIAANSQALAALQSPPGAADAGDAAAGPAPEAGLARFLASLAVLPAARRHALEERIDARYGIAEWRSTALVDADGILEERALHARVAGCLPEGLSLAPADLATAAVRRP